MSDDDDNIYDVEKIVDHKLRKGKVYCRIRWKDYGISDDTWEKYENLTCPEILAEYLTDLPDFASVMKKVC